MKQATHYIEQLNVEKNILFSNVTEIKKLGYSKYLNDKYNLNVVAIFKIYPKHGKD